jgi:hypothetical protein
MRHTISRLPVRNDRWCSPRRNSISPSPSKRRIPQRLPRHQHRIVGRLALDANVDQRQAVAVGRHQLGALAVQPEERSRELEARLLARHREEHLTHQAAETPELHRQPRRALDLRQARKVDRRQAVDAELRLRGVDAQRFLALERQPDLVGDQRAYDLDELARLHRERALALHLGGDRGDERHVEIRRREVQATLLRRQQQV